MAAIYIDGEWFEKDQAKISVYDHGLLYGDGVFEGLRYYSGNIFKLDEHLIRLYESAAALSLEIPCSPKELAETAQLSVKKQGSPDGYIRILITRGRGALGISPWNCEKPSIIVIADTLTMYPEDMYVEGIPIVTAATRKIPHDLYDPRIKSLNYLSNIMAKIEARTAGCLEAVMLNREGFVTECTGDNIFIFKNGILKTPPVYAGILAGITRGTVLEQAIQNGIVVQEIMLTRYDLYTADECFLTGSGAEVIPVIKIDGRSIGSGTPGENTHKIRTLFRSVVTGSDT